MSHDLSGMWIAEISQIVISSREKDIKIVLGYRRNRPIEKKKC